MVAAAPDPGPAPGPRADAGAGSGPRADAGAMRMSDAEAVMWAIEHDPALRSDFSNLTILDGRPDPERLRATVHRACSRIPRLRQRVVPAPLGIVPPLYAEDPAFDPGLHVRGLSLDGHPLLGRCAAEAERPFDRSRPLWEFVLIDGLEDGRCALLQRLHHTITDGVGGLRLSLSVVDLEPDPAPDDAPAWPEPSDPGPAARLRDTVAAMAGRNRTAARRALGTSMAVVRRPHALPGRVTNAVRYAASARRQLIVTDDARSDVMTGRSLERRFVTTDLSLDDARSAARRRGGSVNDVLVTVVAGALGRYHARHGSRVTELRMGMPVSRRGGRDDVAANAFTMARALVPIAGPAAERFAATREVLAAVRDEHALGLVEDLAGFASALPAPLLAALGRAQTRTTDFVVSNLRGSPVPLWLAGRRILATYPFGPRVGCPLNVTVLSYDGRIHLGANLDPAAIADPAGFAADLAAACAELLAD